MTRAGAELEMTPASALPMLEFGVVKLARLKALNISQRNWTRLDSPKGNSRWRPKSTFTLPGPTRMPRPELP